MSVPTPARVEPSWPADFPAFAERSAGRSFACTPAFLRAVERHLPGFGRRLWTVREDDGRLVAALVGYLERRWGGAWLRALPFGTPAGPLFDRGLNAAGRARAAASLWSGLERSARREGWLGGDVTLTSPASEEPEALPPRVVGRLRDDEAHTIDLGSGVEAWRGSLRHSARKMLRRAGESGVVVEPDAAALHAVYALHVHQLRSWGGPPPRPVAFYRELLEPPTTAELWVGRREGRVLCGILAFVDAEETYLWWSGSALEARSALAFPQVLATIITTCGSRRVNLGFSGRQKRLTDFKEQLGAVPVSIPILDLAPRPRTPYHALLVWARDRARARGWARSAGAGARA